MDIKTLIANQNYLFAAFIGRSSSGKSAAAASMPKPFHEIDTDIRANGIVNAVQQGWLSSDGIDIEQFKPFDGYMPLQIHLNKMYDLAVVDQLKFKSVDIGSGDSVMRLLENLALNSNSKALGHVDIGGLKMTGYGDFRVETQGFHRIIDFLRALPCHVTISFKIVNQYGRRPGAPEGSPAVILGEKLTLTGNLSENILGSFNDVYKFHKVMVNGEAKHYVEFVSEIARNSYQIPAGLFDITRKPFWPFFQKITSDIREGSFKISDYIVPQAQGGLGL